jgi:hypothetical protein
MITTETPMSTGDIGPASRVRTVLVADETDATREFLAENVSRHIFAVLCPTWLCAGSG